MPENVKIKLTWQWLAVILAGMAINVGSSVVAQREQARRHAEDVARQAQLIDRLGRLEQRIDDHLKTQKRP